MIFTPEDFDSFKMINKLLAPDATIAENQIADYCNRLLMERSKLQLVDGKMCMVIGVREDREDKRERDV